MNAKVLDKNNPEGFLNPAVGGVYVLRTDPLRWFKVCRIDGERIVTNTGPGAGSTNTSIEWFLDDMEDAAETFAYFPAGTPEAKEAVKNPRDRLRGLLRGLGRLV